MQIFANPNFNFIRWRWHAIILSAAVIGSGLFTIYARGGPPLGVDFSGGTVLTLKFDCKPCEMHVIGKIKGHILDLPQPGSDASNVVGHITPDDLLKTIRHRAPH